MSKYLFLLVFGLLSFSCSDDESISFIDSLPNAPANPDKAKLLQLVNDARSTARTCDELLNEAVPPLNWSNTLATVAQKHAEDMDAAKKLSHRGTNGSFLEDRLEAEGYIAVIWAENLAQGSPTEEDVVELWMNSPGHCENIMLPDVLEIGVGTSGAFWTMVLAARQ